jgi:hypothetical protein
VGRVQEGLRGRGREGGVDREMKTLGEETPQTFGAENVPSRKTKSFTISPRILSRMNCIIRGGEPSKKEEREKTAVRRLYLVKVGYCGVSTA